MSRIPHYIKVIDEVDTIIFDQKRLEDGARQSSGKYTINEEIVGDTTIARLTPEDEDNNQDRNFIIDDDEDTIITRATHAKRNCSGNTLHIYSPAGFVVGSVRDRHFKCKADKEICGVNHDVHFLLTKYSNGSDGVIKIKQKHGRYVVATVSSSLVQNEKVKHSIIYTKQMQKTIPALQKILIVCAVLACCQQNQSWLQSKYKLYCKDKDKVWCRLYHDRKGLFCVLCFIFPAVIVMSYS